MPPKVVLLGCAQDAGVPQVSLPSAVERPAPVLRTIRVVRRCEEGFSYVLVVQCNTSKLKKLLRNVLRPPTHSSTYPPNQPLTHHQLTYSPTYYQYHNPPTDPFTPPKMKKEKEKEKQHKSRTGGIGTHASGVQNRAFYG